MKTTTTTKITANLSFASLRETFPIGQVKVNGQFVQVNALQDAIDDGTIKAMMQECADQLYKGDLNEVIRIMKRNMSSMLTNLKKSPVQGNAVALDKKRVEMLRTFLDSLAGEAKKAKGTDKTAHSYTMEEIEAIDPSDYKLLDHIYQGMMSYKARYRDRITDEAEFLARLDRVSDKRSAAKKAAKKSSESAEQNAALDAVIEKLKSNKLTKAEKQALIELLQSIKG